MIEYKPFVLKCPECTAPSEEFARNCRYCNVPLVWRPVISLSALEAFRPSAPPEPEHGPQPVLPFGPHPVMSEETMVFQIVPQIPFQPRTLKLSPHCADYVQIDDIQIGAHTQLITPAPIPGWAFNSNNVAARIRFDPLNVGQFMTIRITNIGMSPVTVSGIVCGEIPERRDVMSGSRRIGRTVPVFDDPPHMFSRARR